MNRSICIEEFLLAKLEKNRTIRFVISAENSPNDFEDITNDFIAQISYQRI